MMVIFMIPKGIFNPVFAHKLPIADVTRACMYAKKFVYGLVN